MPTYRRDPTTGAVFVFGGLIGNRTLDDRRSDAEAFQRTLENRADLFRHDPDFYTRRARERQDNESLASMIARRMREMTRRTPTRSTVTAPARPRRDAPVEREPRNGMLVAIESFDFLDSFGRKQHVRRGRTYCLKSSDAYLACPSAFA